jgi:4-hydroxy-tetrahydrodipicolinate synthase
MYKYVIFWYKITGTFQTFLGGAMAQLRGAFTALITPMTPDGSVDYEGFRKLVRFQLESGISGLVPLGTTGETPTLDESEEDRIIDIAMAEAKGKVPVILGAGVTAPATP